jgi:hypothetical protein
MGKAPSPPPPLEEDASVLEQRKRMRDEQNRQHDRRQAISIRTKSCCILR